MNRIEDPIERSRWQLNDIHDVRSLSDFVVRSYFRFFIERLLERRVSSFLESCRDFYICYPTFSTLQHPRQDQKRQRCAQIYHHRGCHRGRTREIELAPQALRHVHVDLVDSHFFDQFRKLRGIDGIALRRPDRQGRVLDERRVLQQRFHGIDIVRHEASSYGISYRLADMTLCENIDHLLELLRGISTLGDVRFLSVSEILTGFNLIMRIGKN